MTGGDGDTVQDRTASWTVRIAGRLLGGLLTAAALAEAADLYRAVGIVVFAEQRLLALLGLALGTLYILKPATQGAKRLSVPWFDALAAVGRPAGVCLPELALRTDLRGALFAPPRRPGGGRGHPGAGGGRGAAHRRPRAVHLPAVVLRPGPHGPLHSRSVPGARRGHRPAGDLPEPRLQLAGGDSPHRGHHHRHRLHLFRQPARPVRRLPVLHRHFHRAHGPVPRRLRQDRGHRLVDFRLHLRQRHLQRGLHRGHHHPADEERRVPRSYRGRHRGRGLHRRPVDAAHDGRRRLRHGRVPADLVSGGGAGGADPRNPLLRGAVHPGGPLRRDGSASRASTKPPSRPAGRYSAPAGPTWCRSPW